MYLNGALTKPTAFLQADLFEIFLALTARKIDSGLENVHPAAVSLLAELKVMLGYHKARNPKALRANQ
ncbi:hypothetical protein N7478_004049 [Penicillium angulare]|uniref:uncharacterized protein n=1 Tax=Penicillium angulare TaxID=116970 RepID=UPI00253FE077|nr:uncharacterized protein N7478_004049 [Penicillium angulare]KAJ5278677.1 hypothetical protein N7478_004049 [Penicillium angulare]